MNTHMHIHMLLICTYLTYTHTYMHIYMFTYLAYVHYIYVLRIYLHTSVGRYQIFTSGIWYYKFRPVFGISRYYRYFDTYIRK